jgi:L-seryl-tRNA(Ser) seleniumtransferase
MIAMASDALHERAEALAERLEAAGADPIDVVPTEATVGGGSLPGEVLPSFGIALRHGSAAQTLTALRRGSPAIVARIEDGRVVLDLRTVDPGRDEELEAAIRAVLGAAGPP